MIDQIKNKLNSISSSGSNNVARTNAEQAKAKMVQKVNTTKAKVDIDGGKVSQFVSKETIKEMAKEPPIDKVSTNRIKNAIANGSYPIDLNKIADALFDAYKDMKD
ncbi:MAG: flagellar biosynthesis anti-sigma factor FlgM [Alphaproteobacteria bacterium]|jgi:negative regulator of flagellin synthesis FlgM|nr:flagellar biosynthesis anti-sigma factor FlgM [Alphaproteobacteria bacterium]